VATASLSEDVALARCWADLYRSRGWNPLPSRTDAKRPLVRFSGWWDVPAPADLFDRHPTTNVQLMLGRRWRLLAVDLDGAEAQTRFKTLGPCPATWATHSGGGGLHLWFRLPANFPRPLPKTFLWRGEESHNAIERLCDHSLLMVPPSLHPSTGERYRFLDPRHSPVKMPLPAACPDWLLRMEGEPARLRPAVIPAHRHVPQAVTGTGRYRASDVLDAIPDKVGLAESWGLRVASRRPNAAGWVSCHAISREDRSPSASLSAETGRYWEPGLRTASLFDLAVALGVYLTFPDAVRDLGSRFGARVDDANDRR
jgi:hypothetical protein